MATMRSGKQGALGIKQVDYKGLQEGAGTVQPQKETTDRGPHQCLLII